MRLDPKQAIWVVLLLVGAGPGFSIRAAAQTPPDANAAGATNNAYPIDLPTTLRLARARNLDIQIAREALAIARASHESALEEFFPWLTPGAGYHRRDGMAQAVPAGTISETHYQSYSPGAALTAQLPLGDAIYQSLASKQLVEASGHALESQGQGSTLAAAQAYFDLLKAKAVAEVLREVWDVSLQYQKELQDSVKAGIAFKGDALRVETQTQQYGIAWRQAIEQWRVSSAGLAGVLHLDALLDLTPSENDLVPLTLAPLDGSPASMVRRALKARPELHQSQAAIMAAQNQKDAVTFGPLIPSLNAQVFAGGLGGGPGASTTPFGPEEDYFIGVGWRLGPGGLFDYGRIHASRAQLSTVRLQDARLRDEITRQVVEGHARASSLLNQIDSRRANLATAGETLRLARSRREFGVGVVLEYLLAQQDYSAAKTGYVSAIADYNKAQFNLTFAIGNTLGGQTVHPGAAAGESKGPGD